MDIDSALVWTVEWHKAKQGGANMREVSSAQIDRFAAIPV
jgi:hypothetical protein